MTDDTKKVATTDKSYYSKPIKGVKPPHYEMFAKARAEKGGFKNHPENIRRKMTPDELLGKAKDVMGQALNKNMRAITEQLIKLSIGGNLQAINTLLEYTMGKTKATEVKKPGGGGKGGNISDLLNKLEKND